MCQGLANLGSVRGGQAWVPAAAVKPTPQGKIVIAAVLASSGNLSINVRRFVVGVGDNYLSLCTLASSDDVI